MRGVGFGTRLVRKATGGWYSHLLAHRAGSVIACAPGNVSENESRANLLEKDKSTMSSAELSGATRLSLISRALARQADAWCELVDLNGSLVAHWCHRFGCDAHATASSAVRRRE